VQEASPKFRILIADDDSVIATTLTQILRLSGYETETVSSGEEAVSTASLRKPDILISDVVMGGITGIEAAIRILEFIPACFVILISGQANTTDYLAGAFRQGHQLEILPKPVHPKILLERIATFTAQRPLAKKQSTLQETAQC
jgi:CheY-like chemotaxis protein